MQADHFVLSVEYNLTLTPTVMTISIYMNFMNKFPSKWTLPRKPQDFAVCFVQFQKIHTLSVRFIIFPHEPKLRGTIQFWKTDIGFKENNR